MAAEFDACWSTVIAAADTHAAFGDAPDNGWVQGCRLDSGHAGLHGSDAGAKPFNSRRAWLQWVDEQSGHRLVELAPCPAADGADAACSLFADHGGPHRFTPTSSTLRFGTRYEPDTTVSRNGFRRPGTMATAPEGTAPSSPPRQHSAPETPLDAAPTVDEALLAVAEALATLATAIRNRDLTD